MREIRMLLSIIVSALIWVGCSGAKAPEAEMPAFPEIDSNAVLAHTRILSSDEFEGRAPGTKGEDLTVQYIVDQFTRIGIKPGNTDGTYIQKVPLVGITPDPGAALTLRKGSQTRSLKWQDEFVAWTKQVADSAALNDSELVFVGYGIQAPEYSWDDYKGVDLKGKTLVVLVGDPPVPDPNDPSQPDPEVFGGKAMTYYGRWTYKHEMGAQLGAAGVLIVHETEPAAYPFSVVQGMVTESFDLIAPDRNMSRCAIEGWLALDQAKQLFSMDGKDFDALKKSALSRDFKPVPLGITASIQLRNTVRTIASRNVAGKLEGSDPALKDEYVIYNAHWDHLGVGPEVNGDRIYNGAVDNATGIGGLIEIARAYRQLPVPPRRSILFLAVTGEEQGLLGSSYYAANPICPLARTLAVINMDALNVWGKTSDVTVIGLGNSELDDYAGEVAGAQGRVVRPDPMPEKGFYYRSDHFPFAKAGVPALASEGGIDYVGKPAGYGKEIQDRYTNNDYHQPSDIVRPDWDLSGAVQDLQYYWMVGYRIAQAGKYPEWKPATEFKARREAQLRESKR